MGRPAAAFFLNQPACLYWDVSLYWLNVTFRTSLVEEKQSQLLDVELLTETEGVTRLCLIDHVVVSVVTGGMWNDSDEEGEAV